MIQLEESTAIDYPPPPCSEQDAIRYGADLRLESDKNLWKSGWHACLVTEQFGHAFFDVYAAAIGRNRATLARIRWVCSKYSPDQVNRFPGLPFTFFELVAALMDDEPERALELLDNAFSTPGLTSEQFAALVHPDQDTSLPLPFTSNGMFACAPFPGGGLIIGVRVTGEIATWQRRVKESPLFGEMVKLSVKPAPI